MYMLADSLSQGYLRPFSESRITFLPQEELAEAGQKATADLAAAKAAWDALDGEKTGLQVQPCPDIFLFLHV